MDQVAGAGATDATGAAGDVTTVDAGATVGAVTAEGAWAPVGAVTDVGARRTVGARATAGSVDVRVRVRSDTTPISPHIPSVARRETECTRSYRPTRPDS